MYPISTRPQPATPKPITGHRPGAGAEHYKAMYERSLGININLGWGVVLLAFGAIMLLLALRGRKGS